MNICNKTGKPCGGAAWTGYCRFTACTMPPEIKREPMFETEDEISNQVELLAKYLNQKVDADNLRHALKEIMQIIAALDRRIEKLEKRSDP